MRNDPLRNFRFTIEIGGNATAGFSECTGFDISTEAIDYREGKDAPHVRKLPGLNKYGNVTLKWGITDSMDLYNWYQEVIEGTVERKDIAVIVHAEDGQPKARFEIEACFPIKYDPADLNAKGNEVAIATLELCNEGVKRTQ